MSDVAAKQRAYRERLKARRREGQGPTDAELARAVRDMHIRLEYEVAVHPERFGVKVSGQGCAGTRYVTPWRG